MGRPRGVWEGGCGRGEGEVGEEGELGKVQQRMLVDRKMKCSNPIDELWGSTELYPGLMETQA